MKIGIIRGNGIGPEIVAATQEVLLATGLPFEWVYIPIADEGIKKYGHPLPQEAVRMLEEVKVAIKAPLLVNKLEGQVICVHKDGSEHIYPSLNNAIRRELKLFMNPRPVKGVKNISGKYENLDVVVMREITEDVYFGVEYMMGPDAAHCIKLTTRKAAQRAARYSLDYARAQGRKKVTCIHKANVMGLTDGMFLTEFRKVAEKYKDIESDDLMVDAATYVLAKSPETLDVLCCPNQYGDIISDLAAGLAGSMGLAPGANIGENAAIFEASHGAAPDIAGKGIANPAALILSGALMLRHLNLLKEAQAVEEAVFETMGQDQILTPELGGTASTKEFTRAICKLVKEKIKN